MRLFIVNCLLLASVAVSARPQTRDISYFTNLIKAGMNKFNPPTPAVATNSYYNLFRLPGYDDIMIKIIPKPNPQVTPANVNAFKKVVGTKTNNDTLQAVKNVNNLLTSQILDEEQDDLMKNSIVAVFPALNNGMYVGTGRPASGAAPMIKDKEPVHIEAAEPDQGKAVSVPDHEIAKAKTDQDKAVEKPQKEKEVAEKPEPLSEPEYTYEILPNEPIFYVPQNNPDVFETIEVRPGPACGEGIIDETIKLGAYPPVETVISIQPQEINPYGPPLYRYPFLPPISDGNIRRFPQTWDASNYLAIPPIQPIHTHSIGSRPIRRHKPIYRPRLDIIDISSKSNTDNDEDEFIDPRKEAELSQTTRPTPSQTTSTEAIVVSKPGQPADQTNKDKINIVSSKDNIANGQIPSHIYKEQISPITDTVPLGNALSMNAQKNHESRKKPHYYYFVPPVPHKHHFNRHRQHHKMHKSKVVANFPNVTDSNTISNTTSPQEDKLKDRGQSSNNNVPVAQPFLKNYFYLQHNPDGSSVTTKENKDDVSVDVKQEKNRGDIPDEK